MTLLFMISLAHWRYFPLKPLTTLSPWVTCPITTNFSHNSVVKYLFPWPLPLFDSICCSSTSFILWRSPFWSNVFGHLLHLLSWNFVATLRCEACFYVSLTFESIVISTLVFHCKENGSNTSTLTMILRSVASLQGEHVERGIPRLYYWWLYSHLWITMYIEKIPNIKA